jgi:hypothetical protein
MMKAFPIMTLSLKITRTVFLILREMDPQWSNLTVSRSKTKPTFSRKVGKISTTLMNRRSPMMAQLKDIKSKRGFTHSTTDNLITIEVTVNNQGQ